MTDEMWKQYGEAQAKTVVGKSAWGVLGHLAFNTAASIVQQRADEVAYMKAWVERQLGA